MKDAPYANKGASVLNQLEATYNRLAKLNIREKRGRSIPGLDIEIDLPLSPSMSMRP
ncbi:protein of unknown function [Cupriavidus neocaledonicus]|uniref:Uncharacterized protein n=1 Tax=Cupriavidus neocaledonicus TaxID=1040979 RepID=A0A375H8M9_9BURK|nr:hypothetical protein CBM2605_A240087 [Cupriavidus neocaledonicus]SPD48082.1 protein of unknown function [Cupriavidus neocaledonicus]